MAENETVMEEMDEEPGRKKSVRVLVFGLVGFMVLGGFVWWYLQRNLVDTDNAYVKADISTVSTRVPGTVTRVMADNDQPVESGKVLVELDPADYRVAVDKARAALEQDEAEAKAAEISVTVAETKTAAGVKAAEAAFRAAQDGERETRFKLAKLKSRKEEAGAELTQTRRDTVRYESLYNQGAGTERQQEHSQTAFKKAKAQLEGSESEISGAEAALAGIRQQIERAGAQLDAAKGDRQNVEMERRKLEALRAKREKSKTELEAAELNLSYCIVSAPIQGVVAQKNVQVGDRLQPGQPLMAIVPLHEAYIEANFKETQLTGVRIGQPVEIKADLYPGVKFRGRVAGIRAGTGAAFALLPAENATGNWIKVVQRIPVKIVLDPPPAAQYPLRMGMSLDVVIDTTDKSGSTLLPAGGSASPSPPEERKP